MNTSKIRLVDSSGCAPLPHTKQLLGRILVDRGLIKTSDLLLAIGHQRMNDVKIGHMLVSQGQISEADLYETLAIQNSLPFIDMQSDIPDLTLQTGLDPHQCLRLQCVPWRREGETTILTTSSPEQFENAKATLPAHLHPVKMAIATRSHITEAIRVGASTIMATTAETRVPEDLSCRSLPAQIKTTLAFALPMLVLALALQWLTFAGLYRAIFGFAVVMVFTGIVIKTAAAFIQLFVKEPEKQIRAAPTTKLPRVSLLIPLHDETEILEALLRHIGMLTYPETLLDVILIVEASDTLTRSHLETTDLPNWMRILIVPAGKITTKPRAMNYALPFCRGDIIGIYDAEDAPNPDQLSEVVDLFARTSEKTACIQAVLDFYNARSNALSRFFAIEYATWFRLILPGIARMGFAIPLGGTSVFFRRNVLEKLDGWDAHNVTEDADLGIRLARAGYQTTLISSVTLEEANNKAWPWIKQRSRWLKGYLITYFTHMRRPFRLLFELGAWKFLGFQAFFLSSISQYMLAPLIWSCMALYFGAPQWMDATVPAEFLNTIMVAFIVMWFTSTTVYIVAVSGELHRHLIPWIPFMSAYMALGTLAIYKGAWELITKPFYWEKTAHGHSDVEIVHSNSEETESSLSLVTKATEI